MIRPVVRMGDAGRLAIAPPVAERHSAEVRALIADTVETLRVAGGVGLAAPDIAIGLRVVVFGFEASERHPGEASVPLRGRHCVIIPASRTPPTASSWRAAA